MRHLFKLASINLLFASATTFAALIVLHAINLSRNLTHSYGILIFAVAFVGFYTFFTRRRQTGRVLPGFLPKAGESQAAWACALIPLVLFASTIALTALGNGQLPRMSADWSRDSASAFAFIACAAAFEESLFRGYLFVAIRERYPANVAMTIASLLFALFHYPFKYGFVDGAAHFAFGLAATALVMRSGSLFPAWLFHVAINWCADFSKSEYFIASAHQGLFRFTSENPTTAFLSAEIAVCLAYTLFASRTR